jgi:hypothetical protein
MEELQTKTIDVKLSGKTVSCQLKERDFGDYIVFDVFTKDNYLFTISKQGDVLFNESDMTQQKNIMDPRDLNELIEHIKQRVTSEQDL